MLAFQAAGKYERTDHLSPDPLGLEDRGGELTACRADLAAMKADHSGDADIATGRHGILQLFMQGLDFGHRLVPVPNVVKQLTKGGMRLNLPDHRADLVGQT